MTSIPREVEYTAEYERKLYESASPYISNDPLSIIKEYCKGPRLFHNNVIDPSTMFYLTIEFNGPQPLSLDAKRQEVKTDGASFEDIRAICLFLSKRQIIDETDGKSPLQPAAVIVEKRKHNKHLYEYMLVVNNNDSDSNRRLKSQAMLGITTANGTIIQRNSAHSSEFLCDIAPHFTYKAKMISISSIPHSFASKKWVKIIGGHGYMAYPMFVVSQLNDDMSVLISQHQSPDFFEEEWKRRQQKCKLNAFCGCEECSDDEHEWCKKNNKECPYIRVKNLLILASADEYR